jgi:hypothetical protein
MAHDTANPGALYSASGADHYATLSGDVLIKPPCRRIRVGTGGDLKIDLADGSTVTVPSLLDGESLDVQATKIYQTGTTALKITIFY